MDSRFRRRPSHPVVVAYLALFVALGGSSYAALRVSSGEIVNNSVRSKDLRNNDVRGTDVRDGSLLAKDFKPGQLPAGEKGDTGATGPQGPTGQQGPPGVSGLVLISASSGPTNSNSGKAVTATCPAGKRVIGSGGEIQGTYTNAFPNQLVSVVIDGIVPSAENVVPGTVTVRAYEEEATNDPWAVIAHALCANVS